MSLNFRLVSLAGTKFDDEAYEVLVPTPAGTVGLFEDHMPVISAVAPGVLSIRKKSGDADDNMEHFALNGGVVEIDGKNIRLISDDITSPEDVSEKEAEAALARAEALVSGAETQTALHEAHRLLHHSSARLQIARLKRRHHN